MQKDKVCIIGSGNWGSTIAKIVGNNVRLHCNQFDSHVTMWVYEEMIDGRKLSEIINQDHENVKYLPGLKLPENVVAVPDLPEAALDATLLIFVVPHQFVGNVCNQLKGKISPSARGISLIKGIEAGNQTVGLVSENIKSSLNIDMCVLMGANLANEIAHENFSESTIGYRNHQNASIFQKLFNTHYFRVSLVEDVIGVELCGALKNIVAIAAGIIDGLKLGDNTKAAIIRIGLAEMRKFCKMFYEGSKDETFFESCGVADLITTCYGGRNRKVAEALVTTGKTVDELEREMLNGQKLQGPLTAKDVFEKLSARGHEGEFPLFTVVYRICYEGVPPASIIYHL